MSLCKIYVPQGALGLGVVAEDVERAVEMGINAICCDAGSTDSGPYYLGNAATKYARSAIKSDMRPLLVQGLKNHIPVLLGSCGTSGTDAGVKLYTEIALEILKEEGLHAKIAQIFSSQDPKVIKQKYLDGKVHPLGGAPEINADTFESCTNIVALAGVEPFIQALNEGADVVFCGRSTDTAIMTAYPVIHGVDPGVAWHAAKLIECGPLCTDKPSDKGGIVVEFEKDSAILEPSSPLNTCSVYSVSAHLLYENSDPIVMVEPGCMVDTSTAKYEQIDGRRVRISHATYTKTPYTLKLEGARKAGYQTINLVGVRDREIMRDPEGWIQRVIEFTMRRHKSANIDESDYSYSIRPYGWNAVYGGKVPEGYVPNEIGFLLTVTANTQEKATQYAKTFNPALLHCPYDPDKQIPSFAYPFSPAEVERGAVYEFVLNHVVETDDPMELLSMQFVEA